MQAHVHACADTQRLSIHENIQCYNEMSHFIMDYVPLKNSPSLLLSAVVSVFNCFTATIV